MPRTGCSPRSGTRPRPRRRGVGMSWDSAPRGLALSSRYGDDAARADLGGRGRGARLRHGLARCGADPTGVLALSSRGPRPDQPSRRRDERDQHVAGVGHRRRGPVPRDHRRPPGPVPARGRPRPPGGGAALPEALRDDGRLPGRAGRRGRAGHRVDPGGARSTGSGAGGRAHRRGEPVPHRARGHGAGPRHPRPRSAPRPRAEGRHRPGPRPRPGPSAGPAAPIPTCA